MGKNNESILDHNLVEWFNCLFTHHITAKIKSSCVVLIFNFIPIYTLLRSDVQIDFFVSFTFRKKCLESISLSWIFIFSGEWTTLVDLLNFFKLCELILCFISVNGCSVQFLFINMDGGFRQFPTDILISHKKNINFKPSLQRNFNETTFYNFMSYISYECVL